MATDYQRVQDINEKEWNKAFTAAEKMCKVTKKSEKLWARYILSLRIGNDKMNRIAKVFLRGAVELEHPKAVRLNRILNERSNIRRKIRIEKQTAEVQPIADKLIKAIDKRVSIECSSSNSCSHPYWSGDALFVSINGFLGDDAPYQGYYSGGPESITTYRRSYLGSNLSKIATIVKRFDLTLYKSHSNFFIKIPFNK